MKKLPKNIKHTQHSPTCYFLCIHGFIGLHTQQLRETIHIVSLHQENFLVLTKFVDESATFFKVSTFTNNTFLSSTMSLSQSDIEHQYVFSLNVSQVLRKQYFTMTVKIYPLSLLYQPNTCTKSM